MVHTYIHSHDLFDKAGYKWDRLTKSPDVDLLFLKDITIVFSVAFDCCCAQQVRGPTPIPNYGIISSCSECRLVIGQR